MIAKTSTPEVIPADNPHHDPLVNRISHYLEQHPEVRREELLRDALEHEINALEMREALTQAEPTEQEVQDHAWVEERMASMRRPHRSFGERLRRLLHDN